MASKKDEGASKAVFQYMLHQNRPYSTQDIWMNLHKEHGKPVVQRVVDQLVADNKIKEKINGKQKCYVVNQENIPAANDEELAKLDVECEQLTSQLSKRQEQFKETEGMVRKLNSALTTQEAVQKVKALEEENEDMAIRLEMLENKEVLVSAEEKAKIKRAHQQAITHWKKRRRMCKDALDSILESWPKSKKDLFEEIGIETDEDVGARLP